MESSPPDNGLISDKFGRRKTLLILIAGLTGGYLLLGNVDSGWPVWLECVDGQARLWPSQIPPPAST